MRTQRSLMFVFALCPMLALGQVVKTEEHSFRVVKVVEWLEHPWSLAFVPDGRMLITERPGRLRVVVRGQLDPNPVRGVPQVAEHGQGGLHDVVPHPKFAENKLIYLAYAARGPDGVGTELARATFMGDHLEHVQVLFRQEPKGTSGNHFGGRIVFDRAGYVYLTLGDRGEKERAQKPDDHARSVIRLHDDGRVPEDNPFFGKPGWKPEKFDLGHRNQQGAALHPKTGILWTHEHGPQGADEINIIHKGRNTRWPVITYRVNYGIGTKIGEGTHKAGMEQPIHYWVPSIAPSGMAFYTGDKFPKWQGDLFVGALKDQMLVRLRLEGDRVVHEERMLKGALGRIRDVRVGPDGYVYLLNDEGRGMLARLEPD